MTRRSAVVENKQGREEGGAIASEIAAIPRLA
jgi:hypothetical protein